MRRRRERLTEFPGTTGNLVAPVSAKLEELPNTVLLALTHEDAVDVLYQRLLAILRQKQPLSNAHTCPPRSFKPM